MDLSCEPNIYVKESSREKVLLTLHVMTEMHVLLQKKPKKYHAWSCQNVCDALTFFFGHHFYSIWHQAV